MAEGSGIWTPPGGSADPRREEGQPPREPEGPTPEQLEEELRRLHVADVVVSSAVTVAQLGFAKLAPERRDLGQVRLAIESLRALVPVLEQSVPPEVARELRHLLAELQLGYAGAVGGAGPGAEGGEPNAPTGGEPDAPPGAI